MPSKDPEKKEELVKLMAEMATLSAPECAKCRIPHSCCAPEYCKAAAEHAENEWGVTLSPTGHPTLDFMGWDGEKSTGCTIAPHLRPMCTLHTCEVNSLGFKRGDATWTENYFALREKIEETYFEAFQKK